MPFTLVASAFWSSPALADEPGEQAAEEVATDDVAEPPPSNEDRAAAMFEQSVGHYRAGRFEKAADLLTEAYALHPTPVLLYNLGRAYEGLGQFERAISAYERYLAGEPSAKDEGAIERRIVSLRAELHEREALAERERQATERADTLATESGPEPILWPWIIASVGVAGVASGVAVRVVAQRKYDDAKDDPVHRTSRESFREASSLNTVAITTLVAGGVVAGVGVTWLAIAYGTREAKLEVGLGSLTARGTW